MGENHAHVSADEFSRLALRCDHCEQHTMFSAEDVGPVAKTRCTNCGQLMAGVKEVVTAYREFYRELKRQKRPGYFVVKS